MAFGSGSVGFRTFLSLASLGASIGLGVALPAPAWADPPPPAPPPDGATVAPEAPEPGAPATPPGPSPAPRPGPSPAPQPGPSPATQPAPWSVTPPDPPPLPRTATARPAAAPVVEPLRIALECEGASRTKVCPEFLLGFIEASPLFLASPRAGAQVTLHVAAVPIANDDRIHLRFVGDVRGAPASIEVDVDVNTRGTDDEQRAQLRPAFLRGVALYVATIHPEAVKIELVEPKLGTVAAKGTSPWGVNLDLSGDGNWTEDFQSARGFAGASIYRVSKASKYSLELGAHGGFSRRPPLVVDDQEISLDTSEWGTYSNVFGSRTLSPHFAVASSAWWSMGDPKGQSRHQLGANLGLEWDYYPSDEPRGNVLAVAYFVALRGEVYNYPNDIGQDSAIFPFNRLSAAARIRRDKTTFGLNLTLAAEIFHPTRRHDLSASPSIEWQIGDHVDIGLRFSGGKRAVPQPVIPDDDYEAQGRAAYAQPLYISGSINLRIHFDPTNGVRNNRFENL